MLVTAARSTQKSLPTWLIEDAFVRFVGSVVDNLLFLLP